MSNVARSPRKVPSSSHSQPSILPSLWQVLVWTPPERQDEATALTPVLTAALHKITLEGQALAVVKVSSLTEAQTRLSQDYANIFALWIDYPGVTPQNALHLIHILRKTLHNSLVRIILVVGEDESQVPFNVLLRQDVNHVLNFADLRPERIKFILYQCFRDYQEKKAVFQLQQQQNSLRKTVSYLRLILERIPQQVFWKDANSVFLGCNTKWAKAAGFENPEQVIGLTDEDLIPDPEVARLFRQEDQKIIEQGQPKLHSIATKYREGTQGRKVWLDISKIPLYDSQGNPLGIVGVLEDITERKVAEEALENSLSLLRAIFESITDGVLAVDGAGNIISYNQKFLEMWKITETDLEESLVSQRIYKLAEQLKDPQGFLQRVAQIYSKPDSHSYDLLDFQDGRIFERYSQPQRIGEMIVGRVWNFRDITLAKQAEAALQQQMRRALLLGEITQQIRSSLESEQIFQITVSQVGQVFGVSRCNLRLYVTGDSPQFVQVAEYLATGETQSLSGFAILIQGNPYAEQILAQDQAIAFHNVSESALLEPLQDLYTTLDIRSMLAVRTSYQGAPNGVIILHQCDRLREWTEDEIELLEAVAAQVGIAIAHAHLLQQEQQQRVELDRQNQQLQQQIQQRQRMEAELRQSARKLRTITASVPGMVFEAVSEGVGRHRLSFVSDGVQELYGMTPQEALDTPALWERIVPEDREALSNAIAESQHHLTPYDLFTRIYPRQGGQKWIRSIAQPKPMPDGSVIWTGVQVDVTESKQQELALIQAREAADAANCAKSAFLANMSHELRTPLNAILGFSQLLSRISGLNSDHQEYISIINRSGEHLLTLINDVLEMSKIEAGRVMFHEDLFDLYNLLDSLEDLMHIKAQSKGLDLIMQRDRDLPRHIYTDESKLRQVLLNLLSNGIKFTETGQVILQATCTTPNPQPESSPTLQFTVTDTGLGIAPHELELLFSPFAQTETGRKSQQGTGLGLAISRQFVQLMGGELTVQSEVGQGSTFQFEIPVRMGTLLPSPPTPQPLIVLGLAPQQPTYRILVVEDLPESRQLLVTLLKRVGFEVKEAQNGVEAITEWHQWHPHLIWMDIRMPVLDGLQATRQIRRLEQQAANPTIIIAVTASAFEEQRTEVLAAGCNDFVRKPFQEAMVLDKIAQYLGVQYLYSSSEEQPMDRSLVRGKGCPDLDSLQQALSTLDVAWLQQLHLTAMQCSEAQLLPILEALPESHHEVADVLRQWINNFQFEDILTLTQNVLEEADLK